MGSSWARYVGSSLRAVMAAARETEKFGSSRQLGSAPLQDAKADPNG
jgi:hypothetical protein